MNRPSLWFLWSCFPLSVSPMDLMSSWLRLLCPRNHFHLIPMTIHHSVIAWRYSGLELKDKREDHVKAIKMTKQTLMRGERRHMNPVRIRSQLTTGDDDEEKDEQRFLHPVESLGFACLVVGHKRMSEAALTLYPRIR